MHKIVHKLLLLVTFIAIAVVAEDDENTDTFESWGSTQVKVYRLRYTWTIKNFSYCEEAHNEPLYSPYFSDGINNNHKWKLLLYPKGEYYSDTGYVALYISVSPNIKRAAYKLAILGKNDHEIIVGNGVHRFDGNAKGIHNFAKQYFILNEENGALVDNQLTILCEINATIGSENYSGKLKQSSQQGHLVQDLTFLLENPGFSDVTLSTRGTEFKAHKAILAIRSLTFKAMFELDPNITRVEIDNVDPVVVREMLHYIYTDKTSNLQHLALGLLDVAVEYELDGLKSICEGFMFANITIENSAEYFILGNTHLADDLKNFAKTFIIIHIAEVIHTRGFKEMIRTHPYLLQEVFVN